MKTHIFDALRLFVVNVQRFNALQFNARGNVLIQTFGEDNGIKFLERHERYGLWFLMHEFTPSEQNQFFDMVLNL